VREPHPAQQLRRPLYPESGHSSLEIYCFGRPGHRLLGVMIVVMFCIIAHEPGTSTPEFSSTTIVIPSDGR
jgi:hypothetical protein